MRSFQLSLLVALLSDTISAQPTSASAACDALGKSFSDQIFYPGNGTYEDINDDFWSISADLSPACVFTPINAEQVAEAVKTFKQLDTPFAVKGGGGMTIDGYANINSSGVLLAADNMTTLELSEDQTVVTIGPGNLWDDVYKFLKDYNLTTLGARLGLVGVPGFLLGGGITFMSSEFGWASTLVVKYECVLADGQIIEATEANEYSDLYWALKGGGNSFAIVTKFYMETISSPVIYAGYPSYGTDQRDEFVETLYWYTITGDSDVKAGIEPRITWSSGAQPSYVSAVMYDGDNANPAVLSNWTGGLLTPAEDPPLIRTTMYDFARAQYAGMDTTSTVIARFAVFSVHADMEALNMVIDDFFPALDESLSGVVNLTATLVFMPFRAKFVEASLKNGGNPMGIDASRAPFIWLVQSYSWPDAADDETVDNFIRDWTTQMEDKLDAKGFLDPFKFMLDAAEGQKVFENYGAENLQQLKETRAKYDPDLVYTRLMPGGWKVENAA